MHQSNIAEYKIEKRDANHTLKHTNPLEDASK